MAYALVHPHSVLLRSGAISDQEYQGCHIVPVLPHVASADQTAHGEIVHTQRIGSGK